MTPVDMVQVLGDCECDAVALQSGGGPATFVTVIVTFDDGVNPCSGVLLSAVPPK